MVFGVYVVNLACGTYGYDAYTPPLWSCIDQTSPPSSCNQTVITCHMHISCGPMRPLHIIHGYFGPIRFGTQALKYEYILTHTSLPYDKVC